MSENYGYDPYLFLRFPELFAPQVPPQAQARGAGGSGGGGAAEGLLGLGAAALGSDWLMSKLGGKAVTSGIGELTGAGISSGASQASTMLPSLSTLGEGGVSGATTFTPGATPATSSLSGVGTYVPGVAGAAGLYDFFKNKRRGKRGVAQAGASGAGIGWTVGGPVGAGIGAVIGTGLGLSRARKSTKEREADRWKAAGRDDLASTMKGHDYFAGTGGEKSRDEKFLTADAIRVNPENYNNVEDWDSWDQGRQDKFLNALLKGGHVREKKGGIYYNDDKAKEIANAIRSGTYKDEPTKDVVEDPNKSGSWYLRKKK